MKIIVFILCLTFAYVTPKQVSEDILSKNDVQIFLNEIGILCNSDGLCSPPITAEETQTAQMNEFFDKFLTNIDALMVLRGLEPAKVKDIFYSQRHDLFPIGHVTLVMNLTEGLVHQISTLHRKGDAFLIYTQESNLLHVKLPIAFNDLNFEFNYGVSGMDLHRHGQVTGKFKLITMLITFSFDLNTLVANLDSVERTNSGTLDMNFSGHILTDWLLNLASDVAVILITDDILDLVQGVVEKPCQNLVDQINNITSKIHHQ